MKKITILTALFLSLLLNKSFSQEVNDTIVYLLTCNPGTETYSIYGHSALRIVDNVNHTDIVYNWGVFDFNTPHFGWKFAKGRLDYMLIEEDMEDFLRTYHYEKRAVFSQRANLKSSEIKTLISLIQFNLRPENVKYRYDFFYDDCSTRIRDLFEKSLGNRLVYPPQDLDENLTFRDLIGKYQKPFPWLRFGIDLLIGSPADKLASFRDKMFLPLEMKNGLSQALINREGKMSPLLQNPETLLDFDMPDVNASRLFSPENVFSAFLILLVILIPLIKRRKIIDIIDITVLFVFSLLALLLIFFNFFTDHQQLRMNLNIIWLNPLIIVCLLLILFKREGILWFRILFAVSAIFLAIHLLLPQDFNNGILPLILILVYRTSARSAFAWNPFTLK